MGYAMAYNIIAYDKLFFLNETQVHNYIKIIIIIFMIILSLYPQKITFILILVSTCSFAPYFPIIMNLFLIWTKKPTYT